MLLDEDFARSLSTRYKGRPGWMRPSVHLIATAEEREPQRRWLNEILGSFPDDVSRRIIGRLAAEENFLATYHELAGGRWSARLRRNEGACQIFA